VWFVLNTGIFGMYRIRIHAGIYCWDPHAQLALTNSSIQPTWSLIILSATLSLATCTIYVYIYWELAAWDPKNNKNRYRHIYTQLNGYIPITPSLVPKRVIYAIITLKMEGNSLGSQYDGRNRWQTIPQAMRTMWLHLVTFTENSHNWVC